MGPDICYYANIYTWTATASCLEIGIKIEPWGKYAFYHREFTNVAGSYSSRWVWIDGNKESKQSTSPPFEVVRILDQLVREHEVLGSFCGKYGIEKEVANA